MEKQAVRSIVQKHLGLMSEADYITASKQVLERVVELLKSRTDLKQILIYQPLFKWHEVDVTSLPELLPAVQFGTVANTKDAVFPKKKYDAVIIPLLGFNKDGYRLGRGGGWYDRFLATQPQALKIGAGYEETLVDFEPEPHDVRMDVIVTEERRQRFYSS